LGVVEGLGDHQVHAHVAVAAAAADRAQHGGGASAGFVLGKDLVELVATAARREPAHVGPLAIAVGDLLLVGLVLVVVVIFLGQAEVHECAMPGISKCHM
jgi:hypothetical protein